MPKLEHLQLEAAIVASSNTIVYEGSLPVCLQTCAAEPLPLLACGVQSHPAHLHGQVLSADLGQVSSTDCDS